MGLKKDHATPILRAAIAAHHFALGQSKDKVAVASEPAGHFTRGRAKLLHQENVSASANSLP